MTKKKVGLALSGGGAKGAAHAGMIHFFDEIGFKPHIICGTSAGAIVGAMYASGKTGEEILNFFGEDRPYSTKLWSGNRGIIRTPEIRKLFEKHFDHDTFEGLHIPLITTATDMFTGNGQTFNSGPLIDRILCSAAFPGVFSPMEMDGTLYSDGGITNNFPADVLDGKVDFLIGMYLSPNKPLQMKDLGNTKNILARTVDIQGTQAEENKLALCDIGIFPRELVNYSTFDLKKDILQELFDLGYASIKPYKQQLLDLMNESHA